MNVGNLVRICFRTRDRHPSSKQQRQSVIPAPADITHHPGANPKGSAYAIGVIVDVFENDDGFCDFEVAFEGRCEWFSDLELEVIDHVKALT